MVIQVSELLRNGFNVHEIDDKSVEMLGEIEQKQLENSAKQLVLHLGRHGELPGNRYLHAIRLVSYSEFLFPEARQTLRELFREVEFGSVSAIRLRDGGDMRGSAVYVFASPEPIDGKHMLAKSEARNDPDNDNSAPAWSIELAGTGETVKLPDGQRFEWQLELDPHALTVIPSSMLRIAAHIPHEDEPSDRARLPRPDLHPKRAAFELSLLPEDWRDSVKLRFKVAGAVHYQFKGSEEGLRLYTAWVAGDAATDAQKLKCRETYGSAKRSNAVWQVIRKVLLDGPAFQHCQASLTAMMAAPEPPTHRQRVRLVAEYDLATSHASAIATRLVPMAEAEGLEISKGDIAREIKAGVEDRKRERHNDEVSPEVALAQETLRIYFEGGLTIRYAGGRLMRYYKGVWQPVSADYVSSRIVSVAMNLDQDLAELQAQIGKSKSLSGSVRGAMQILTALVNADDLKDPFGRLRVHDVPVFNLLNGELWWNRETEAFELRPHNPRSMFTMQLAVAYDPEATCRRYDQVLAESFAGLPDASEVARHYLECQAYTANMSRSEDMFVMSHGDGRNGKSTLARVLAAILGRHAAIGDVVDLDKSKDNHANEVIEGLQAFIDIDLDLSYRIPANVIKKMADQNQAMSVNVKFVSERHQVLNKAVLWLVGNGLARVTDNSDALCARAQVFRHTGKYAPDDKRTVKSLDQILFRTEAAGILNRLVEAMTRLAKRGAFDVPKTCRDEVARWRSEMSELGGFFAECCTLTVAPPRGHSNGTKASELFKAYQEWSASIGERRPYGRNDFIRILRQTRGLREYPLGGYVAFGGINLRDHAAEARAEREREEAEKRAARAHLSVVQAE